MSAVSSLSVGLLSLVTIGAYAVARAIFVRSHQQPLLHPVFLSAGAVIAVLLATGRSFDEYRPASDLLTWPLGPATVALALPVYRQRAVLKCALGPLAAGIAAGTLATIAAILGAGALGGLETPILDALAVKSVTAAIAVELARLEGADPSLTAAFVVVTGTIGAMIGPLVLSRLQITDPVARGVALGTISHAQGAATALHEHDVSGALASLALVGAALLTSLIAPLYVPLVLRVLGH